MKGVRQFGLIVLAIAALLGGAIFWWSSIDRSPRVAAIQRGEIFRAGDNPISQLREVTAEQTPTESLQQLQASTRTEFIRPQNWPATVPWDPLRHFGPFYRGSGHLTEIQVRMDGLDGTWFFNDFLSTHPDTTVFQKYFPSSPSSWFPGQATPIPALPPLPQYVPGQFPNADGLHDILLDLQRIEYSSRYGGSVELLFKTVEDYEYDIRKGTTLWDLKSLKMLIYVVPRHKQFNFPVSLQSFPDKVHIEFETNEAIAYTLGANIVVSALPENPESDLETVLSQVASALSSDFRRNAAWFVYGYLHSKFPDLIGLADIVDMIEISDGFFDVHTRQGTAMVFVAATVIDVFMDTELGDEEIGVTIGANIKFTDGSRGPRRIREFEIRNRESTPWTTFEVFPVEACTTVEAIEFGVELEELDDVILVPLGTPDEWQESRHTLTLACTELQDKANNGIYGLMSMWLTEGVVPDNAFESDESAKFSFQTSVSLLLR